MPQSTGSKLITASELIHAGECDFFGYIINSEDAGDFVEVYDGNDPDSGELLIHTHTRTNVPDSVLLPFPRRMSRGLYVKLDDGIENVTVFYNPVHSDDVIRPEHSDR